MMLTIVRYMTTFGPPLPDAAAARASVDELACKAHAARQRGLYADERGGAVRSPTDVSEHEAHEMVNQVRKCSTSAALSSICPLSGGRRENNQTRPGWFWPKQRRQLRLAPPR